MTDVVIVAAKRTAVGNFMGSLTPFQASDLGAHVIKETLKSVDIKPEDVDDILLGQVLTAGTGQNPARQAALKAGIPEEKTAMTINQVCGSGLRSVMLGAQAIANGDAHIVIAGGQESMTNSHHSAHLRSGAKMGSLEMKDTMIVDGLSCAMNGYHMGITAENIAEQYNITREDVDTFAFGSQSKADAAIKEGAFEEEIIPIEIPQRKADPIVFKTDEFPRLSPVEKMANLRPAFKKDGVVTAGNASGINDGAAIVILMTKEEADKRGLSVLGTIKSFATAGVDPKIMGTGPIPASKKALEKAAWSVEDLDVIEANEAFASQAISVNKELGWDTDKVNQRGGAIALGHPIGASGCRCLVTLLHIMKHKNASKGLVTLCIGGGQGVAMTIER